MRKGKCNFASLPEEFVVNGQANFVTESSVRIVKEVLVIDVVNKRIVIENPASVDFLKEL